MKKILMLIIALLSIGSFNSCIDDNEPVFVIDSEQTVGPEITSPTATVNLNRDIEEQNAYTLVWDDAAYNILTPITYTIETAIAGTNFAEPNVAAQTTERFYSWNVKQLNSLALATGLEGDIEGNLELRVVSSVGTNQGSQNISDIVNLTLTPYPAVVVLRELFLVGNAVDTNKDGVADDSDWNNDATNTYLSRDPNNEDVYYFQGFFEANQFKLLEQKGSWQPQWGLSSGSITSSEILGNDPDPFMVDVAGFYRLEVNVEDLTYTFQLIDASSAPTYSTVAIIGSARTGDEAGWSAPDSDMIQSPFNPHIWYIEDVELFDGELKFRHSDDWPGNWGGSTPLSGEATTDGNPPNIPVSLGTYDIWFNDLDGRYILVPVQ